MRQTFGDKSRNGKFEKNAEKSLRQRPQNAFCKRKNEQSERKNEQNFAHVHKRATFALANKQGAIAQLVEQRTENPCVPGSIPGGTTCSRELYDAYNSLFCVPPHPAHIRIVQTSPTHCFGFLSPLFEVYLVLKKLLSGFMARCFSVRNSVFVKFPLKIRAYLYAMSERTS